jgi:adenine-specific DNA methylase
MVTILRELEEQNPQNIQISGEYNIKEMSGRKMFRRLFTSQMGKLTESISRQNRKENYTPR